MSQIFWPLVLGMRYGIIQGNLGLEKPPVVLVSRCIGDSFVIAFGRQG
jgi:hypothetical protein